MKGILLLLVFVLMLHAPGCKDANETAITSVSRGLEYQDGIGVPKNEVEAAKLFRKAADLGDEHGQVLLAMAYHEGHGVPKDLVVAYKWYLLSGAQGHKVAREIITSIEKQLSRDQRAEGQRLAREFVPKRP